MNQCGGSLGDLRLRFGHRPYSVTCSPARGIAGRQPSIGPATNVEVCPHRTSQFSYPVDDARPSARSSWSTDGGARFRPRNSEGRRRAEAAARSRPANAEPTSASRSRAADLERNIAPGEALGGRRWRPCASGCKRKKLPSRSSGKALFDALVVGRGPKPVRRLPGPAPYMMVSRSASDFGSNCRGSAALPCGSFVPTLGTATTCPCRSSLRSSDTSNVRIRSSH